MRDTAEEVRSATAEAPGPQGLEVGVVHGDFVEEFEDFVRVAASDLGRVAWVLTLDHDEASDLVQEAFARAYARWSAITSTGQDALPYVRRVLVNLRTDRWRRRRRRRQAEAQWSSQSSRLAPGGDPGQVAIGQERLVSGLSGLSDRQRRVVALRYLEDLSVAETAEVLGMTRGAVKMAASRALAHLRAHLGEDDR